MTFNINYSPYFYRSILLIAWTDRAIFFIFKIQQCIQVFIKWRRYDKKTPSFLPFSLYFSEKVNFWLLLPIERFFCARMQYVSAHPVGVQPLCHGSYATMALGGSCSQGDVSGGGSMRGGAYIGCLWQPLE